MFTLANSLPAQDTKNRTTTFLPITNPTTDYGCQKGKKGGSSPQSNPVMDPKGPHLILQCEIGVLKLRHLFLGERRKRRRESERVLRLPTRREACSYLPLWKYNWVWVLESLWMSWARPGVPLQAVHPSSKMKSLGSFPKYELDLYALFFKCGNDELTAIFFFFFSFLWNQHLTPGANPSLMCLVNLSLALFPQNSAQSLAQYRQPLDVY